MVGISSLGVGSGLDLNSLVVQLVAAEAQPAILLLDNREADLQSEISALGLFRSALSEFQLVQKGLVALDDFQSISVKSGDDSLFSVTVSEGARIGSHSVEVQQLAQAQKLASKAFSSAADSVGSGILTFRFGTFDDVGNTFTANASKSVQTVTIDPSDNSVSGIRDAVNNANIGVTASIVDDGTGQRLVFSSVDTGVENSLEISVSSDLDGNDLDDAGLSQLAYDPTAAGVGSGKNLTETITAKDALLVVDGLNITRSGNSVSGVVEGVTLELKSAALGTTTTLTVEEDTNAVSAKVNTFVSGFNELVTILNSLTSFDVETGESGPLLGDVSVRGIEFQLRKLLGSVVPGLNGSVLSLVDIGISTQSDGTLALDDAALQTAIDADSEGVARLFSVSGSVSDSLVQFVGFEDNSVVGNYAIEITQLATQGLYSGGVAGSFPLTIDDNNDIFSIKVDGTESSTVILTQGTYNTAEALAAEIQSRINGDAALSDAGVSVGVTFQSGSFQITSSSFGSVSSVEISTVDVNTAATLGLSVGAGTVGVDVTGTIGGAQALGSGRTLTGTGNAAGLSVDILGGSLGARGDLSFARGISAQLDTLFDGILASDNVVDSRISSLSDQIEDIGEERVELDERLVLLEQRYVEQFTALDTLLAELQSTSEFLTQQLAVLPGS